MHLDLKPHQEKVINELDYGKILRGGVGSGKTYVAAEFYARNDGAAGKDVVVITTAKKRDSLDWEGVFAKIGVGKEESLMGKLTVDSYNNLDKYKDVTDALFIFDEQRMVGSGAWTKTFIAIAKRNRWIMLSATPGDTWLDYIPVFVANGFYKNRTEFKREHVIYSYYGSFPKVERYVGVNKLVKLRNQILVEMPYQSHTTRIEEVVEVEYDEALFKRIWSDRWNPYEDKPIRNVSELFSALRRAVFSDPSRLREVRRLLDIHPRLIVFYTYSYELEMLRTLSEWMPPNSVAEWNGEKHQSIPTGEQWVYLVQYTAGAEGWNCTTTDAMIFYSMSYSYKLWEQAHGRIDRLDTPFDILKYYIFKSRSWLDSAYWKALTSKENFQEAKYGRGLVFN